MKVLDGVRMPDGWNSVRMEIIPGLLGLIRGYRSKHYSSVRSMENTWNQEKEEDHIELMWPPEDVAGEPNEGRAIQLATRAAPKVTPAGVPIREGMRERTLIERADGRGLNDLPLPSFFVPPFKRE